MRYLGLIDRYRDYLPVNEKTPLLTLTVMSVITQAEGARG
jgi:hypothetical protein